MSDKIALQIAEQRIERFLSYQIEADMYNAADAFSLELANPEIQIKAGQRCDLYVNDRLELTGIIDAVDKGEDKTSKTLRVSGRDLMGLLVDSSCEEFLTLGGMTVKALAERLLRKTPFIDRKKIIYQKGTGTPLLDAPQNLTQIEPGDTIFETLKGYAAARGLMFFALPDGTMVFGLPKSTGEPMFTITRKKTGETNIIKGTSKTDISQQHSSITVIGQVQGPEYSGETINVKGTVKQPDFPFYKPLVVVNNDTQNPTAQARMLRDKEAFEAFQLSYTVPGYAQHSKNWAINELCTVNDETLGISGAYLVYSRSFSLSKDQGRITELKLSIPGVAQ